MMRRILLRLALEAARDPKIRAKAEELYVVKVRPAAARAAQRAAESDVVRRLKARIEERRRRR